MNTTKRPARRWARRWAAARGYNMIEVVMALAILAVGASGVVALQKVTVLGVTNGRNLTAGSMIAARHVEAIRTDAIPWIDGATLGDAPFLSTLVAAPGVWAEPGLPTGALSGLGQSDVVGTTSEDVTTLTTNPIAYCTHVRATVVANTIGVGPVPILVRIDVRTFWAKSGRPVNNECADPGGIDTLLQGTPTSFGGVEYTQDSYGFVFVSTSVRRNDALGT